MRTSVACAVALFLVTSVRSAFAQPSASSEAAAEALYLEAEALVADGRIAAACAKYLESERLDPQLGTLLHLADCYERNGQTASAWVSFREANELAARKRDPRAQVARERADALHARLSFITISVPVESQVPALELERDGQRVASAIWGTPIPVDPGKHAVVARAAGRTPWTTSFELAAPGNTIVSVPLLATEAVVMAPAPPPAAGPRALSTIGWMSLGGGAVGIGLGVAFAFVAAAKGSDADAICPRNACSREEIARYESAYSDAQSAATTAQVALGVGAVFAVAGAVLLVTGRMRGAAELKKGLALSW